MRRPVLGADGLAAAVSLLSAGCAARRPLVTPAAPAVLPSAADLEAALRARRDAVSGVRALARLRYDSPEESNTSRQAIIVSRPDRLRIEVLSLFGAVFVLTVDDGALTAYAPRERTVYYGPASPENLWRYARLGIPVSDLVDIVLATPPPGQARRTTVEFDPVAGQVRLRRQAGDGSQSVWFSDTAVPVAAERRGPDGQVEWHAAFDDHELRGGLPIATRIRLELPAWRRSMEMALEEIDVNPALEHSVFAFQPPPGSTVVSLDGAVD
jgi:outer membrane lipoprotein-sorting protein